MISQLKQSVFGLACRAAPCDIRDTIVVVGHARSGTTWLAELLRSLPDYKYMNEPFQRGRPDGIDIQCCIAPGEAHPQLEAYLEKALTGQIRKSWKWKFETESAFPRLVEQLSNRKLIAKFVRAHQMLHWMLARFDVRDAVLIVRHPCAVVASMREMRWFNGLHRPEHAIVSPIPDAVHAKFADVLDGIETNAEVLAARWCLNHYFLFHEHVRGGSAPSWVLTTYERLVTQRLRELERILAAFGERVPEAMRRRFDTASSSASDSFAAERAERQLSKWKDKLSEKQIDDILRIVEAFELDFYTDDLEPDYGRLMQFQRDDARASAPTRAA